LVGSQKWHPACKTSRTSNLRSFSLVYLRGFGLTLSDPRKNKPAKQTQIVVVAAAAAASAAAVVVLEKKKKKEGRREGEREGRREGER